MLYNPTFESSLEIIENFGIHKEGGGDLFELKIWDFLKISILWKIMSYNFQSRRPIMKLSRHGECGRG